jgi:hypothetical protein
MQAHDLEGHATKFCQESWKSSSHKSRIQEVDNNNYWKQYLNDSDFYLPAISNC